MSLLFQLNHLPLEPGPKMATHGKRIWESELRKFMLPLAKRRLRHSIAANFKYIRLIS